MPITRFYQHRFARFADKVLPMWSYVMATEPLSAGPDVAQLEAALAALGYDADGSLVVDGEYDEATRVAIEAWQLDTRNTYRVFDYLSCKSKELPAHPNQTRKKQ